MLFVTALQAGVTPLPSAQPVIRGLVGVGGDGESVSCDVSFHLESSVWVVRSLGPCLEPLLGVRSNQPSSQNLESP